MIHVTAAIIRNEEGRILICQRGPGGNCEYLWEFPGGKLEPGETPEECIIRECREELEIDIAVKGIFAETTYQYPDREIAFTFFDAAVIGGRPKMDVHNDMRWVTTSEMENYEFCPADIAIVEILKKTNKT